MTGKENVRISKVLKDFNIGMGTLVEFLKKKGFEIEPSPNAKISGEAFDLVIKEFGKEQIIKEQSKKVAIKIKEITEMEAKKNAQEEEHVQEVLIKSNTVSSAPAPKVEPKIEEPQPQVTPELWAFHGFLEQIGGVLKDPANQKYALMQACYSFCAGFFGTGTYPGQTPGL